MGHLGKTRPSKAPCEAIVEWMERPEPPEPLAFPRRSAPNPAFHPNPACEDTPSRRIHASAWMLHAIYFVAPAIFTFTSVVYTWPFMSAGWTKIARATAALLSFAI